MVGLLILLFRLDSAVPGNPTAKAIDDGAHHAHHLAMYLSISVAFAGIGLSILMYLTNVLSPKNWKSRFGVLYDLSLNKYYFDENYNKYLYQPT